MHGVSLIMPVYHAGKRTEEIQHLHEALHSVIALTLSPHMPSYELIIVNDASRNPATKTTLDGYARDYPWIKVLNNDENKGPSYARNRALEIAQYDFIAGVDADDILTMHAGQFYRQSIDLLAKDSMHAYINPKIKQFGTIECLAMMPKTIRDREVALIGYAPACAVYRADDVRAVGGWNVDAPKAEDWKLAVDVMAMRWRSGLNNMVSTLPGIAYLYRQYSHGENVNARSVDRAKLREFMIKGNEDFYRARFGTDSVDDISDLISTFRKKVKNGGILRGHFENIMQAPVQTTFYLLSRSQKLKRIFDRVGVANPFIPSIKPSLTYKSPELS